MKDTGEDAYLCEGCGWFYSIESDTLLEINYWDMPATVALTVMEIRSRQLNPCHIRKRSKVTRTRAKGFRKLDK